MKANPLSRPLPTRELDPARAKIFVDNFTDSNGTVYGFGAKGADIKRLAGLREDQSLDDINPRSTIMRLNEELDGMTMEQFVIREIQRQSTESQGPVNVDSSGSRNGKNKDKAIKKAREKNRALKASFKSLFKYISSKKAGSSKSKHTVFNEYQDDDNEIMHHYEDLMETSSEDDESE